MGGSAEEEYGPELKRDVLEWIEATLVASFVGLLAGGFRYYGDAAKDMTTMAQDHREAVEATKIAYEKRKEVARVGRDVYERQQELLARQHAEAESLGGASRGASPGDPEWIGGGARAGTPPIAEIGSNATDGGSAGRSRGAAGSSRPVPDAAPSPALQSEGTGTAAAAPSNARSKGVASARGADPAISAAAGAAPGADPVGIDGEPVRVYTSRHVSMQELTDFLRPRLSETRARGRAAFHLYMRRTGLMALTFGGIVGLYQALAITLERASLLEFGEPVLEAAHVAEEPTSAAEAESPAPTSAAAPSAPSAPLVPATRAIPRRVSTPTPDRTLAEPRDILPARLAAGVGASIVFVLPGYSRAVSGHAVPRTARVAAAATAVSILVGTTVGLFDGGVRALRAHFIPPDMDPLRTDVRKIHREKMEARDKRLQLDVEGTSEFLRDAAALADALVADAAEDPDRQRGGPDTGA